MELSKEYFDEQIGKLSQRFDKVEAQMATKADLRPLATKQDVTDAVDELARIVGDGFLGERHYLAERLDVGERVQQLEGDMQKIKLALRIS